MTFLQRHQDHTVIDADGRAVAEGQVVGARRQADIVDHELALAWWNHVADLVLHRLEDAFGVLDPGARGRTDVKLDLPAIDDRKKVTADQRQHHRTQAEQQDHHDGDDEAMADQFPEQSRIAVTHRLEIPLERGMEARKQAGGGEIHGTMMLVLQQQADDNRRQRPR